MLHTLLLNATYEPIAFLTERKAFKLLANGKVDVLAEWNSKIKFWNKQIIGHPATIIMKYRVRWIPRKIRYNPMAAFKRDLYKCQYCGQQLILSKVTIDHILPKSRGGENSWKNCVACCFVCNNVKGNKTPEEAKMPLLRKPFIPQTNIFHEFQLMKNKHISWADYISTIE